MYEMMIKKSEKDLDKKIVNNEDTSVIFYDLSYLEERVNELIRLFPQTTLHAVAVKANPIIKILEFLNFLNVGAESASLPELYLAEKSGFDPDKIVFDSPVTSSIHRNSIPSGSPGLKNFIFFDSLPRFFTRALNSMTGFSLISSRTKRNVDPS